MKLKNFLFATALLLSFSGFSQKYTVNGMVKDARTNEPIIGAAVYVAGTDIGTATDTEGFFSLNLSRKRMKLKIAFIGYVDTVLKMKLSGDTALSIFLRSNTDIKEVEVEDDEIVYNPDDYSIKGDIKDIPAELNEKEDVISEKDKVIIPLIVEKEEYIRDIYLRNGDGYNQNLLFLDNARVFKSNNVFDFIPVVNDDVASSYQYFYGNYPARFGEHMTSVLDVKLEEGSPDIFSGSFYIDLMQAGFSLGGPVMEGQSSFFVSGRKTYLNYPYTGLFRTDETTDHLYWARPDFYDLNLKFTHQFSENDQLSFHFFTNSNGIDTEINETDETSTDLSFLKNTNERYSNITSSLNYVHNFNPDLNLNTSLNFSNYNLIQTITGDSTGFIDTDLSLMNSYNAEYNSGNNDIALKLKLNWYPNEDHTVKFGANFIYHTMDPVQSELRINDYEHIFALDTSWSADKLAASEYILYAEDQFLLSEDFMVHAGIHFSAFTNDGSSFWSVQPRVYGEYRVHDDMTINASYAYYKQYIHYLSNYAVGLGSDIFMPSGSELKPAVTHRISGGAKLNLPFDIHIKADAFYEYSENIYSYRNGFGFFDTSPDAVLPDANILERFESGRADSYGIRVLFNKDINNLRIAAGHTIANSSRTISEVNFGETFNYRYNNRHDFKLSVKYIFSEHFKIYLDWNYRSGSFITPYKQSYIPYNYITQSQGNIQQPDEYILLDDEVFQDNGSRNTYQLPPVHRLDLGAEYTIENHSIGLKIYNLYNRRNPDFVDFRNSILSNSGEDQLAVYTIVPFFPTLTYNYRF